MANRHFPFPPQRASTLLEMVVALAVLGTIVVTMSQVWTFVFNQKKTNALRAMQESIAFTISSKLKSPELIYLSSTAADNGPQFLNCLLGAGDAQCFALPPRPLIRYEDLHPFTLVLADDKSPAAQISSLQYFNRHGQACAAAAAADPQCIFKAELFFYAICPPQPGFIPERCTQAQEFRFAFRVSAKPITLDNGAILTLPSLPEGSAPQFIPLTTNQILGIYLHNQCNLGAVLEGFTTYGQPKCSCRFPYRLRADQPQYDRHQQPLCSRINDELSYCNDNEIFRGLADDGSAQCVPYEQAYDCITYDQLTASCPIGYWLNKVSMSKCSFNCYIPDGGGGCNEKDTSPSTENSSGLGCSQLEYRCCRFKIPLSGKENVVQ